MYRKILAPIDGSEPSRRGLAEAVKIAGSLGATLRILHVVDERLIYPGDAPIVYDDPALIDGLREGGRKKLAEAERFVASHGLKCESELIETAGAQAAAIIVQRAREWGAELIVMGTHGRRGVRRLIMGSDAEHVVRQADVPVLLVRSHEQHVREAAA